MQLAFEGTVTELRFRWLWCARLAKRHEQQFEATGYTQLVEDAEQIVFYGVLAQAEAFGDFAIR